LQWGEGAVHNITDAVVLEVSLLPPRRWATAIAAASVAGALLSNQTLVREESAWGDFMLYSQASPLFLMMFI
jgi:hypothetical protein